MFAIRQITRTVVPGLVGRTTIRLNNSMLCCTMGTMKYTKTHEYADLNGDIATIGITDFAAAALGDVVFVELPSVGKKMTTGDNFGSVESTKAASDVYTPVSGEIVEINSVLETAPETVNASALEKGWFIKVRVDEQGKADYAGLLDQEAYDLVKKESEEDH